MLKTIVTLTLLSVAVSSMDCFKVDTPYGDPVTFTDETVVSYLPLLSSIENLPEFALTSITACESLSGRLAGLQLGITSTEQLLLA